MKRKAPLIIVIGLAAAVIIYITTRPSSWIVITGMVATDEVIVSSEVLGRLQELRVREGDSVTNGEILAMIQPREQVADMAFYSDNERQAASQVTQAEADLRFRQAQTTNQIRQAEANLAAAEAQVTQGEADLENAVLVFKRVETLYKKDAESAQAYDQARTALGSAKARVDALQKQAIAARAAVALAESGAEQNTVRRAAVESNIQLLAAAGAQKEKASVHLSHTEIRSPINGVVDVRAALQGEVVNPGQAIATLIDPDNLWIRADIEESYADVIRIGDKLSVKLPSGAVREGTVFYRRVDADYATQRDVSRSKRDIKTFEIRLRCDNHDRALAVGMTVYVTLSLSSHQPPATSHSP
jgi:multidrug resistance efflux pump